MKLIWALVICALSLVAFAANPSRHVVLIIWDGMRPDFVTRENAPTLDSLAREGVRFRHHHSVYPTATDVNGAALATGSYPEHNGLCANLEYRPGINPGQPVDMGDPGTIRRGDEISGGNYLALPTICERMRAEGRKVALAGTKSVAMLFDRHSDWAVAPIQDRPLTAFAAAPLSSTERDEMEKQLGSIVSDRGATAAERNDYATRALTEFLWRAGVPDFSLLWLSEPDFSEHNFAPGSPKAIAAIKSVDKNLATVLTALQKKRVRDSTDIFVVSDHGFSTIHRSIDLIDLLHGAGFHAGKELPEAAASGDILVAGNGGTVLFYVKEHDAEVVERLVTWLQRRDFTGVLFTRGKHEGTFPLGTVHLDTSGAADVVMSFRCYDEANQFGVAGVIDGDWNRKAGEGTHATVCPYDLHNLMIAAGPDLRRGLEDGAPTSNMDIGPTVFQVLKLPWSNSFDGRVLAEALLHSGIASPSSKEESVSSHRDFADGRWTQRIKILRAEKATYIEEGNGAFTGN